MSKTRKPFFVEDIKVLLDIETNYGYWRMYLFNDITKEYEPMYNEFIFYKGKFFDDLESKPWNDETIEQLRLMSKYFNRNNEPRCVFKQEREL